MLNMKLVKLSEVKRGTYIGNSLILFGMVRINPLAAIIGAQNTFGGTNGTQNPILGINTNHISANYFSMLSRRDLNNYAETENIHNSRMIEWTLLGGKLKVLRLWPHVTES